MPLSIAGRTKSLDWSAHRLMDLDGFQGEPGIVSVGLLHSPSKVLVAIWNTRGVGSEVPHVISPLLGISLLSMVYEELREMK